MINIQYTIDYLKDGNYLLLGHNPINNTNVVLAKADSPTKLLEHGYIDLKITQPIDMSDVINTIIQLETIQSFGGLSVHNEFIDVIGKLIEEIINKKFNEENHYE